MIFVPLLYLSDMERYAKNTKLSHTVDKHLKCHKIQESDVQKSHKYEMSHFDKSFAKNSLILNV